MTGAAFFNRRKGDVAVNKLSIARKNLIALAILALPLLLTAHDLVGIRAADVSSARTELAGVSDIRPLQTVLELLAADMPAKVDVAPAAQSLKETLAADPQNLAEPARTLSLLRALAGVGLSTAPIDAIAKTNAMTAALAENAGITRDPDPDAHLLGGVIAHQLPDLLKQAKALTDALTAAETDHQTNAGYAAAEAHRIAFHEAQDNLTATAAAITADINKAIVTNADGTVKPALAQPAAALDDAVAAVNTAIMNKSAGGVRKGVAAVIGASRALARPLDDEMTHLLQTRIAGFQADVLVQLSAAFALLLAGLFLSLRIISSVTRPLLNLEAVMRHMADGGLEIEVPATERSDEIGSIARATEVLRQSSLKGRAPEGKQAKDRTAKERRAPASRRPARPA